MKIIMGVVHVVANCRNCSWEDTNYLTAQKSASKHAKYKKHTVSIEVLKAGTYDGKIAAAQKDKP